jgi:glycosyltransferase domain-containing protein
MPKLIIPSRNRPLAITQLLEYLARFAPNTSIIIADGSTHQYKPEYHKAALRFSDRLTIDYRSFEPEISYGDRILSVLDSLDDDLVSVGADDDFPLMETLIACEQFLEANRDYVLAIGSSIDLRLFEDQTVQAACGVSRTLKEPSPSRRAVAFSAWPFQTTYAVARRSHLIERYTRFKSQFLVGFHDYTTGIHDCMAGKIKAIGKLGYIRTHTYQHSYLRPGGGLNFLRSGEAILGLADVFQQDLVNHEGLSEPEARQLAERLIRRRIEILVGRTPYNAPGFEKSSLFRDDVIQAQYAIFKGLFTEGRPERQRHFAHLRFVMDALLATAQTTDNQGEPATYETLDAQENV